jgi:NAD(P)-dependent dehydrogenase (short-subunit alcohol dehydrogenase family)
MPPTVVITGASAGVGRAVARRYAGRGARVALLARGQAGLEGAAHEVESLGGRPLVLPVDVADAQAVDRAAEHITETLGPIDVWINNAMVTVMSHVWETDPEEFRRVTEVTYLGAVHGTQAALRRMRPRDHGMIVQVGSALAFRGIPLQSAYCAAKHAVQGFTESLDAELRAEGSQVRVGQVHLPALNTPQFTWSRNRMERAPQPVAPIYQPEVAGRAIVWAADHRRRSTWVGPSTVATIWAHRLAPGLVARHLARAGIDDQLTPLPADERSDDNLHRPADAEHDAGARGPFDDEAKKQSVFEQLARHPAVTATGAMALLGAVALRKRSR